MASKTARGRDDDDDDDDDDAALAPLAPTSTPSPPMSGVVPIHSSSQQTLLPLQTAMETTAATGKRWWHLTSCRGGLDGCVKVKKCLASPRLTAASHFQFVEGRGRLVP
ncbi:hypothetical protein CCHR01_19081 [Colletotrichum chrysophilum]|uniref:Uncharacterized protein n=1 Tax=Colletotrichum chrysophilum TaxID=1836956 RepID=A0AAD9E886_9PEZI|nr:hypothetical protein CCHR01_19081 [Colletotrichum chrysophilum]